MNITIILPAVQVVKRELDSPQPTTTPFPPVLSASPSCPHSPCTTSEYQEILEEYHRHVHKHHHHDDDAAGDMSQSRVDRIAARQAAYDYGKEDFESPNNISPTKSVDDYEETREETEEFQIISRISSSRITTDSPSSQDTVRTVIRSPNKGVVPPQQPPESNLKSRRESSSEVGMQNDTREKVLKASESLHETDHETEIVNGENTAASSPQSHHHDAVIIEDKDNDNQLTQQDMEESSMRHQNEDEDEKDGNLQSSNDEKILQELEELIIVKEEQSKDGSGQPRHIIITSQVPTTIIMHSDEESQHSTAGEEAEKVYARRESSGGKSDEMHNSPPHPTKTKLPEEDYKSEEEEYRSGGEQQQESTPENVEQFQEKRRSQDYQDEPESELTKVVESSGTHSDNIGIGTRPVLRRQSRQTFGQQEDEETVKRKDSTEKEINSPPNQQHIVSKRKASDSHVNLYQVPTTSTISRRGSESQLNQHQKKGQTLKKQNSLSPPHRVHQKSHNNGSATQASGESTTTTSPNRSETRQLTQNEQRQAQLRRQESIQSQTGHGNNVNDDDKGRRESDHHTQTRPSSTKARKMAEFEQMTRNGHGRPQIIQRQSTVSHGDDDGESPTTSKTVESPPSSHRRDSKQMSPEKQEVHHKTEISSHDGKGVNQGNNNNHEASTSRRGSELDQRRNIGEERKSYIQRNDSISRDMVDEENRNNKHGISGRHGSKEDTPASRRASTNMDQGEVIKEPYHEIEKGNHNKESAQHRRSSNEDRQIAEGQQSEKRRSLNNDDVNVQQSEKSRSLEKDDHVQQSDSRRSLEKDDANLQQSEKRRSLEKVDANVQQSEKRKSLEKDDENIQQSGRRRSQEKDGENVQQSEKRRPSGEKEDETDETFNASSPSRKYSKAELENSGNGESTKRGFSSDEDNNRVKGIDSPSSNEREEMARQEKGFIADRNKDAQNSSPENKSPIKNRPVVRNIPISIETSPKHKKYSPEKHSSPPTKHSSSTKHSPEQHQSAPTKHSPEQLQSPPIKHSPEQHSSPQTKHSPEQHQSPPIKHSPEQHQSPPTKHSPEQGQTRTHHSSHPDLNTKNGKEKVANSNGNGHHNRTSSKGNDAYYRSSNKQPTYPQRMTKTTIARQALAREKRRAYVEERIQSYMRSSQYASTNALHESYMLSHGHHHGRPIHEDEDDDHNDVAEYGEDELSAMRDRARGRRFTKLDNTSMMTSLPDINSYHHYSYASSSSNRRVPFSYHTTTEPPPPPQTISAISIIRPPPPFHTPILINNNNNNNTNNAASTADPPSHTTTTNQNNPSDLNTATRSNTTSFHSETSQNSGIYVDSHPESTSNFWKNVSEQGFYYSFRVRQSGTVQMMDKSVQTGEQPQSYVLDFSRNPDGRYYLQNSRPLNLGNNETHLPPINRDKILRDITETVQLRHDAELRRAELIQRANDLQSLVKEKREKINRRHEFWHKKYIEESSMTRPLEAACTSLRAELNTVHRRLIAHLEGRDLPLRLRDGPSKKANYKIMAARLQHEIKELQQKAKAAKLRLESEVKLKEQAEREVRDIRNDLSHKKVVMSLARSQFPATVHHPRAYETLVY